MFVYSAYENISIYTMEIAVKFKINTKGIRYRISRVSISQFRRRSFFITFSRYEFVSGVLVSHIHPAMTPLRNSVSYFLPQEFVQIFLFRLLPLTLFLRGR